MAWIKETFNEFKKKPKQALKEFAMAVAIFAVVYMMMFLAAILQGCTTTKTVEAAGKTTVITTDTTYINHGGTVSIKLSK